MRLASCCSITRMVIPCTDGVRGAQQKLRTPLRVAHATPPDAYHQAGDRYNGEQAHLWQPFQLVWGVLLSIRQGVLPFRFLL